jgi:hypothetical protein
VKRPAPDPGSGLQAPGSQDSGAWRGPRLPVPGIGLPMRELNGYLAGLPVLAEMVPSETQLMQRYGVARLTARKAVRVLAGEGLVEVVPGRGAYVTERG